MEKTDDLDMAAKIREVLKVTGLDAKRLMDEGVIKNRQTVTGWITTGRIAKANLARLAELSGIPWDWWMLPRGVARPPARSMIGQEQNAGNRAREARGHAQRTPVVGEARLGDNGFFDENPYSSNDGWVEYPARNGSYALRCKGDSMRPRIKPGEFVVIERDKTAREGDEVVCQTRDGRRMIKIFNRRINGMVELTSINETDQGPITVDVEDVVHMHPVAAIFKPSMYYPDP